MTRPLGTCLLLTGLLAVSVAGLTRISAAAEEGNLTVVLPEANDKPNRERISKLFVDGKVLISKDLEAGKRVFKVQPKEGKSSVTLVLNYWPKSYTNIIRTKVVKLEKGKNIEVDLTKEDADHPDKVIPIFVPTPNEVVDRMCEMAKVGKEDVVYDIGCGDGRMVIIAVKKFGAKKGVGIDIDAKLIEQCKNAAEKEGVANKCEFKVEDALKLKDLPDATVVLLYVGEDLGAKLQPLLQKSLKPGARVVSHRFLIGDWKPNTTKEIKAKDNYNEIDDFTLHLWSVK